MPEVLIAPAEVELTMYEQNEFERMVAAEFAESDWDSTTGIRLSNIREAGIDYRSDADNIAIPDEPLVQKDPGMAWVALLYGSRIVTQPDSTEVTVETVDLTTMVDIHNRLAATVLKGENIHSSLLITKLPEPDEGLNSIANNDVWLQTIAGGKWPIMPSTYDAKGDVTSYERHDQGDAHTGNFLVLPREAQDLASRAAKLELDYRQKAARSETPKIDGEHLRVLLLPGEDFFDHDPYGATGRGDPFIGESAIMKIDSLTENRGYLRLLSHIASGNGESPAARMNEIINYRQEHQAANSIGRDSLHPLYSYAVTLDSLGRQVGDLVNFISRHENGHNTTQEAVTEAALAFTNGIIRVAEKINGTYTGSESDAETQVEQLFSKLFDEPSTAADGQQLPQGKIPDITPVFTEWTPDDPFEAGAVLLESTSRTGRLARLRSAVGRLASRRMR